MSAVHKFETKKTLPLFASMVIPPMISMLIQSLYNIIDSIFVSSLGEAAIGAIAVVFPLQNITLAVSVGIGVGTSSFISRSLGAKKVEQAQNAAIISIGIGLIQYLLMVVIFFFCLRPFVLGFTDNPVTIQYALEYGKVVLFLCLGQQIHIVIEKIFQSNGQMKVPMYLLIIGCVINIILDPILIYGLLGFPALGVKGAAIATVIGQWCACGVGILCLLSKNSGIVLKYKKSDLSVFNIIKEIYTVAIPSMLVISIPSLLISGINAILSQVSQLSVAVFGLYYKIQTFVYMPTSGLSQGIRPLLGYNYAAKRLDKEKEILKISIITVGVIMLIGTILLWQFPHSILRMFNADESMMEMGTVLFKVISIGYIPSTLFFVSTALFDSVGKAHLSLIITIFRQLVLVLPLAYLMCAAIGLNGVWLAFPISEVICFVICGYLIYKELARQQLSFQSNV